LRSGRVEHDLTAGVLRTRSRDRFGRQAFNYAGTGRIDATAITAPAPELTEENTDRDESSTEWFLRDALRLGQAGELWAGLRHTRLDRRSVRTDGSRATAYSQSFTTPWLALSAAFGEQSIAYVSWGQGIESEVVPNRSRYANRGQALPALRSRQVEAGIKFTGDDLQWSLAAFDIRRPQAQDLCDEAAEPLCVRSIDGKERHRGVEAGVGRRFGSWAVQAGAMKLDAKRTGASDPALDGLAPTNVPEASARLQIAHDLAAVPGLTLIGHLVYEGRRSAVPEGSAKIGGWSRIDLAARWRVRLGVTDAVFRAGVDNATERRAWRESPYQFSHSYLFPLAPRTWRASAEVGF
jgi:iron complex outermembrane receptor protein